MSGATRPVDDPHMRQHSALPESPWVLLGSAGPRTRKAVPDFIVGGTVAEVPIQECEAVGSDPTTDTTGGRDASAHTVPVRIGKDADRHAEGITGSAVANICSTRTTLSLVSPLESWASCDAACRVVIGALVTM